MKLPNNWMLFRSLVLEKIRTYCALKIWPYDYDIFTTWLSNFQSPEDEYVALHLLDSLIVRSKTMAVAGYSRLLHTDLRVYLQKNNIINPGMSIKDWMTAIKSRSLGKQIIFHPVKLQNDRGESGSTLFRLLSRLLRTDLNSSNLSSVKPGQTVILIDDFIGGGTQFETFAEENNLSNLMQTSTVIYCPLIALEAGLNRLNGLFPMLTILPVEIIESSHDLFFSNSEMTKFRNDFDNTVEDIKLHFIKMQSKYASTNMPYWLGKDDVCLPLVFEWGCPNQTFSILWMEYSPRDDQWCQLFSRRS
jgi:hypothetical protein